MARAGRLVALLGTAPLLGAASCGAARQGGFDPATMDPPSSTPAATSIEVELRDGEERMNGLLYLAAGEAAHPTVILLPGFPGNERNLDLAQAMRRAGMNVLFFNYRGSWGSGGTFTFSHTVEDVATATRYLREQARQPDLRIDSTRVAYVGHSMGGWIALQGAARDPGVRCAVALDFWNLGVDGATLRRDTTGVASFQSYNAWVSGPGAPLRTATGTALLDEIRDSAARFDATASAAALATRPVLLLSTPANMFHGPMLAALRSAGSRAGEGMIWDTDHVFSGRRIELARTLIDWLQRRCGF